MRLQRRRAGAVVRIDARYLPYSAKCTLDVTLLKQLLLKRQSKLLTSPVVTGLMGSPLTAGHPPIGRAFDPGLHYRFAARTPGPFFRLYRVEVLAAYVTGLLIQNVQFFVLQIRALDRICTNVGRWRRNHNARGRNVRRRIVGAIHNSRRSRISFHIQNRSHRDQLSRRLL